jgi:arginyl-tRNA synthetase
VVGVADMPPFLLKKQTVQRCIAPGFHGAVSSTTWVLTRLYVVDMGQSLHFAQVFKVLELAGFAWAPACHHIRRPRLTESDDGKVGEGSARVMPPPQDRVRGRDWHGTGENRRAFIPDAEEVARQAGVGGSINDLKPGVRGRQI